MRHLIVGAHLRREDIEPEAEALATGPLFLSGVAIADDQPLGDRDLLIRVAEVRGRLLDKATFIAVRYGFAAWSAAEANSKVGPQLRHWQALLETHRGQVELTLKAAASQAKQRPDRHAYSSGADYLRALRASRAVDVDAGFRKAVEDALTGVATRWMSRDNTSLEFVTLVERDAVETMFEAGRSLKERFPHVPFLLSGPWPLEVFADADQ
jgi:hypothetical protein